jgi:hypothetical protein
MLSLFAMNFHAARLGFEAQNAIAFRLLRLAGGVSKPAANDAHFDAMSPPDASSDGGKRRASVRKVHKRSAPAKKHSKRSK